MKTEGKFTLFTVDEFHEWLVRLPVKRVIKLIQNHHTFIPGYQHFTGTNHFPLVKNMENYHVKTAKFSQIAQNLTTFPDGKIMICRPLDVSPAGIFGANTNGICIEHVGNFDTGRDVMSEAHKEAIVNLNALLCRKFTLVPSVQSIVYHHWYDLTTGKRTNGSGTTKSCPGDGFFGGNTVAAAEANFIPLIKEAMKQ